MPSGTAVPNARMLTERPAPREQGGWAVLLSAAEACRGDCRGFRALSPGPADISASEFPLNCSSVGPYLAQSSYEEDHSLSITQVADGS